jgi:hypothetical protein
MLIERIFWILLVGLFLGLNGDCQVRKGDQNPPPESAPTPTAVKQKQSEERRKKMDLLIKKILEKDPTAMLLAKELGIYASSVLRPLTTNEDDVVRELAIRALNESGGSGLDDVFVNALSDEMPTVRAAALNGLKNHLSEESYGKLLQTYSKVSDPQHRKEIALLIGRIEGANADDLRRVCRDELLPETREGCLAALAKLGDPQARSEFLERLREAKNDELKRLLEYVDYIRQLWALRGLMPVLNDKTPLAGSGFCQMFVEEKREAAVADVKNQLAEILRACDIAVNLIHKIAGAKFPFPVSGAKNYDDLQLAAARRILSELFSR